MAISAQSGHPFIGYASELGTSHSGAAAGPEHFVRSSSFQTINSLISSVEYIGDGKHSISKGVAATPYLKDLNEQLAAKTDQLTQEGERFIILGGDHSSAIGTWSGVATALAPRGELGLIWFDAHMDSHTPETTESGNIHGMPLAILLGYGDPSLTQLHSAAPKIKAEHLCLIGIRSFEPEEKKLLERLKVNIFYQEDIEKRGLNAVFADALTIATTGTAGFGISFDIDVLDPADAPAVGTPESRGMPATALIEALQDWNRHPALLGLEIAEFTPERDQEQRTERIIGKIINSVWGNL